MLPNLPSLPPNLPARRQLQAPADPVRARGGADLSVRRDARGAEPSLGNGSSAKDAPSFKDILRQDLSAPRGKDRLAQARESDGGAGRSASAATAERRQDRGAADLDAAKDAGRDSAEEGTLRDGERDAAGDSVARGPNDAAETRDDAGDRGSVADDGEVDRDDSGGEEDPTAVAAPIATAVASVTAAVRAQDENGVLDEGAARASSGLRPLSTGEAAQAAPRVDRSTNAGVNGATVSDDSAAALHAAAPFGMRGAASDPDFAAVDRHAGSPDAQPTDARRASANASSAQTQAGDAAGSMLGRPDQATVPSAATNPVATASVTATGAASTARGAVPEPKDDASSSTAAGANGARVNAATPDSAKSAASDAAIRALEDAMLAARADRASAPSNAASRTADPALARVVAMEADLAAERVAQAMGQGLVEIDGVDANARTTADGAARARQSAAREPQPAGNAALVADARAMADAVAADRAGSAASASPASTSAGFAASPAIVPSGLGAGTASLAGALGGGSIAADLARQPADGATPAAQLAAKGLGILANQRGGAITMRLEPPALGQLRIELQVSQGAVVADFTAATAEARSLLEANLGMLRERLESQGLSVERITIHGARTADAATQSSGDQRQEQGGNADARERGGERRQDAAGGESRGRRDRDPGTQHGLTGRADRRQGGFASALDSASMTPAARRSA
jgi:flagellar hook-length control protein FliK